MTNLQNLDILLKQLSGFALIFRLGVSAWLLANAIDLGFLLL
jgi:hypothetical protein